jgi:hypothetical protein
MPPQTSDENPQDVLSVAVLGSDAILAALPAHPIQLTHACHQLGFHAIVPLSWGDELIAEHVLRELKNRGRSPAVMCSCERVRARLLSSGVELGRFLISTLTPAAAVGRYLRSLYEGRRIHLTFIGSCEGGADEAFDAQIAPASLLKRLSEVGIDVLVQPTHFSAVVPPDRRRHASLPNGCPGAEVLRERGLPHGLAEVETADFVSQLAEYLLSHDPILVDVAPALGCACAGAGEMVAPYSARIAVMSLEPPRSPASPLVLNPAVDVSLSVTTRPLRTAIFEAKSGSDLEVSTRSTQSHAADLPPPTPVPVRRPPAVTPPRALAATQSLPFRLSAVQVARAPRADEPDVTRGSAAVTDLPVQEEMRLIEVESAAPLTPPAPTGSGDVTTRVTPAGGDESARSGISSARHALNVRRVPPPQPRNRTALYLGCLAVALAIAVTVAILLRYR